MKLCTKIKNNNSRNKKIFNYCCHDCYLWRHHFCRYIVNLGRPERFCIVQYLKNLPNIQIKFLPVIRWLNQVGLKSFNFNEVKPEKEFTEKSVTFGKKTLIPEKISYANWWYCSNFLMFLYIPTKFSNHRKGKVLN